MKDAKVQAIIVLFVALLYTSYQWYDAERRVHVENGLLRQCLNIIVKPPLMKPDKSNTMY